MFTTVDFDFAINNAQMLVSYIPPTKSHRVTTICLKTIKFAWRLRRLIVEIWLQANIAVQKSLNIEQDFFFKNQNV